MPFTIPRRPESLCDTCSECVHARDAYGRTVTKVCNAVFHRPFTITETVRECSDYAFRFAYADEKTKNLAWVMERKPGKPIGFRPPKPKGEE